RRPRRVNFYVNGDRYFKGKKMFVTPNRYYNFNDLLNELTGKLPSNLNLPYGVRQLYEKHGQRITDVDDLQDGDWYVAAGFEGFKSIKYGSTDMEVWSMTHGSYSNKRWSGPSGTSPHKFSTSDNYGSNKPKVITVVRNGVAPRSNVKILLNRRSVQSFEQLMCDISEAFTAKGRSHKVNKLYTIKGKAVQSVSDFFRNDDVFIGVGYEQFSVDQ
ncbi:hypothetical protein LOTGIDRAFT_64764, partial [Lottia gigantea]